MIDALEVLNVMHKHPAESRCVFTETPSSDSIRGYKYNSNDTVEVFLRGEVRSITITGIMEL